MLKGRRQIYSALWWTLPTTAWLLAPARPSLWLGPLGSPATRSPGQEKPLTLSFGQPAEPLPDFWSAPDP